MDNEYIIELIRNSERKSETFLIGKCKKKLSNYNNLSLIQSHGLFFVNDDYYKIKNFIKENEDNIINFQILCHSQNQALPLYKYHHTNVRIEPGAIIRDGVELDDGAIILMNATVNVGANIGRNTMIDMGAVIGSRAMIGSNCHIGANAVIAGVLEPLSAKPVIIEDQVFVGANSVVLEGITIGKGSIIGAMTLVNKDVPPFSVVLGIPGKVIRKVDVDIKDKCQINSILREN